MAIDNAAYIGGLDPNLPTNQDPRAEGAGQIRAIKTALLNTFPNINGEVNASDEDFNYITDNKFHVGMIMMWNGSEAPKNWALCDGRVVNGYATPDLRDRFIKGWHPEAGEKPRATGGSHYDSNMANYVTVNGTALTVAQMPAHDHGGLGEAKPDWPFGVEGEDNQMGSEGGLDYDNYLYKTSKTGGGEAHSHGVSSKGTFDKRPAWYALAFIVYIGPGRS